MKTQFFTVAMLFASVAMAAPITSVEPPDRPGSNGPTYVLGLGTNTISGSLSGCPAQFAGCAGTDYQDNFSVTVPSNMIVTSASLSGSNVTLGGGAFNQSGACFTNQGCSFTSFFSGLNLPASGSTTSYTATSPWSMNAQEQALPGTFNYTVTFVVAQSTLPGGEVPEPGTFALLAPAISTILWLRKRTR
jgi:hypothetical protein